MVALEGQLQMEVEMQTPRGSMVGIYRRATTPDLLAMHRRPYRKTKKIGLV